jgi:hypothetical protein
VCGTGDIPTGIGGEPERHIPLGRPRKNEIILLIWILNRMQGPGLTEDRGCCYCGNETEGCTKYGEILGNLCCTLCVCYFACPMRTTCTACLVFLDFIMLINHGEWYSNYAICPSLSESVFFLLV